MRDSATSEPDVDIGLSKRVELLERMLHELASAIGSRLPVVLDRIEDDEFRAAVEDELGVLHPATLNQLRRAAVDLDRLGREHRVDVLGLQRSGTIVIRVVADRRDWPVLRFQEAVEELLGARVQVLAHEPSEGYYEPLVLPD